MLKLMYHFKLKTWSLRFKPFRTCNRLWLLLQTISIQQKILLTSSVSLVCHHKREGFSFLFCFFRFITIFWINRALFLYQLQGVVPTILQDSWWCLGLSKQPFKDSATEQVTWHALVGPVAHQKQNHHYNSKASSRFNQHYSTVFSGKIVSTINFWLLSH